MTKEVVADYLVRISEGKVQLMYQLLELTQQQRDSLQGTEEEQLEILNELIEKRQEIIKKIDLLDQEFLDKFQILKEQLNISSFADLKDEPVVGIRLLKEKINQIIKITEMIQEIDEANSRKAKENMEEIKQQLKTVNISKKANFGYSKKVNEIPSILIDKKK